MYHIQGGLLYECGTSGGFAFGVSLPALAAQGSYVRIMAQASVNSQATAAGAAGFAIGYAALSAVAAGQTAIVSISVATINVMRHMTFEALLATSAAGSFQLMAKTSAAGASMSVRGGWIKGYKVG